MPAMDPATREGSAATREAPPANCALIEVHVGELKQLFKAMDPAPSRR